MADPLPTDPHDPHWLPRQRTVVLIGIGIQLFFAVVAWALIAAYQPPTAPLVRQVLIPEDLVYQDTDVAPQEGKQLPPVDLQEIVKATEGRLAAGQALFGQHCLSCHGPQGRGDGPAGVALQPPPRNLTSLEGWKRGLRLSDLFRTLTRGLEGTPMPAFDYLAVEERFALAHFVASLATGRPVDDQGSLAALDAEFGLSAGLKEPNTVPLRTAMERLAARGPAAPPALDPQRLAELAAAAPQGAELFARVVQPGRLDRLAALLQADAAWRRDPARLRAIAVASAPANGFRPTAAQLSAADWAALSQYLTLRFETQ